jgi:hypothetical protein
MKLLLIDPGLRTRVGHNTAMLAEFDLEMRSLPRVRLAAAGSAALQKTEFKGFGCTPRPLFRIDGYWRPEPEAVLDPARLNGIVETIVADLLQLPLDEVDGLLMPTVYPLHMIALGRVAPRLANVKLMLGLLMPVSFWIPEPAACAVVGEQVGQAIMTLQRSCEMIVYSETGHYDFGGALAEMATMIPPLAAPTAALVDQLAARAAPARDRLVFGFFGQPYTSKGLQLVAAAARRIDPAKVVVRFCLPPGNKPLCQELLALSPAVEATSVDTSNAEYLQQMVDADVVLTWYDPEHYGDKMSGIVPEAISLGKPLAVSDGCRSLVAFLDRYAPGSFIAGDYSADELAALMSLPASTWQSAGAKARASSAVVRAMKDMRRYLSAGGLGGAYASAGTRRSLESAA